MRTQRTYLSGALQVRLLLATALVVCAMTSWSQVSSGQTTPKVTESAQEDPPPRPIYEAPFEATGPIARVDGVEISAEVFNEDAYHFAQGIRGMLPVGQLDLYRDQLVEHAIDRYLLERAIGKARITIPEEELEREWQAWLVREFPSEFSREQFQKDPKNDLGKFREELRAQLVRQRFIVERYKIEVTRKELERFYKQNGEGYASPEMVRARQILLSVAQDADTASIKKREAEAKLLRERLINGASSFEELARQHSEDASAVRGGDLGWLKRRRMMEEFSRVAFELEVGEISQPVRTFQGWHLIEVMERRESKPQTFEELEPKLKLALFEREVREATNRFLVSERRRSKIERLEKNILIKDVKSWQFDWSTTPLEQ